MFPLSHCPETKYGGDHKTVLHHNIPALHISMGKDIENYVKSYLVCQVTKLDHKKKVGPLQPILIPTKKWEQITTDLVAELPPSAGYITIVVFEDRLTKMVTFPHVPRRSLLTNMPNCSWTTYFDYTARLKSLFWIRIQGSPASSRCSSSRYSEQISDLAQRSILRQMVRVR